MNEIKEIIQNIFSEYKVLFTSFISGASIFYLQRRYYSRKPFFNITSLGFVGGNIKIDDDLAHKIKNLGVGLDLKSGYVDFKRIIEIEQELANTCAEFERLKLKIDDWMLDNVGIDKKNVIDGISAQSCPLIHEGLIFNTLINRIRRRELNDFPSSDFSKLTAMDDLLGFVTEGVQGELVIRIGPRILTISKNKTCRNEDEDRVKLLAYSVAKGEAKNILYASKYFSEMISRSIFDIHRISKIIKNLITDNAEVQISVSFGNYGAEPRLIDPRAVLNLYYGDSVKQIVVEHRVRIESELNKDIKENKNIPRHTKESFLEINILSPKIFVSNSFVVECNFVSIDLDDAKKLIDYYRIGGVGAELSVFEESFGILKSKKFTFSKGVTREKCREIINSINKNSLYSRLLSVFNMQKIKY